MLIQRDQLIAGLPAVAVRDMMRLLYGAAHSSRALGTHLAMGIDDADALVSTLQAEGLIDRAELAGSYVAMEDEDVRGGNLSLWTTTIAGTALSKARIGVPMSRSKAQALLDGVLDRVEDVNAGDDWLHWVAKVVLYGSFAQKDDRPVGDVDLAIWLVARYRDEEYFQRQHQMLIEDDARPSTIVGQVGYAQTKLLRHIRGRSPKVDLVDHSADQPLPPGAVAMVVYRRDCEVAPRSHLAIVTGDSDLSGE